MKTPVLPSKPVFQFSLLRKLVVGILFLAVLMLGARIGDVVQQLAKGKEPPGIAPVMAEAAKPEEHKDEPKAEAPKKPEDEKKQDEAKGAPAVEVPSVPAPPPAVEGTAAGEPPATEEDPESYSDAEVAILRKLSGRRQELDKRARELDQREALLRVTEQRVDKKITDLKGVRDEVAKMVGDATDAQKAQAASLVKIYETMKPKEAAKIFENLEMPVLINVVRRMKEAKVAPILGAMDPVKAKELTAALMEKKDLPTIPQ